MKICLITSEFPPDLGGIARYTYKLAKKLQDKGHFVLVLSRGSWLRTCYEEVDNIPVYRIRFIPFFPELFKLHGLFLNNFLKSIENSFDIIHMHGSLLPVIYTSKPTIITFHGTVAKRNMDIPTKSLHFQIIKFLKNQQFNAESALLKQNYNITAISIATANELIINHSINNKLSIIANGVDTSLFLPGRIEDKMNYILFVGRLETGKGLIDLIECAKHVIKEKPKIKFILIGKGTIENYLKRRVIELGLSDNFEFVGFINSESKLIKYYQKAQLFVLPSYNEGLSTTLLEAMSCELPSVVSNISANAELINNERGLLIPPSNPKLLAEAILELINNSELRMIMGVNSRRYVMNNYDFKKTIEDLEELYKSYIIEFHKKR